MTEAEFEIEITLPEKHSYGIGQRKPLARIVVKCPDAREETLYYPSAVARLLDKRIDSQSIEFDSFNEFLYRVKELSLEAAWTKTLELCGKRSYCSHDLGEKLKQDGYTQAICDATVQRAQKAYLINDSSFADSFVRSKLRSGWGPRRIQLELSRKGLDVNELEGWPDDYLELSDERSLALQAAQKKRLTGKSDYEKLMRFLTTRGFSYAVSSSVVKGILAERKDD